MIISFEGNIGSGKSTLIQELKNDKNGSEYKFIPENLEKYKIWLDLYYKNMGKYALGFQMEVLLSHLKNKSIMNKTSINFIERSPLTCIEIFGKYLLDNDILSNEEQNLCKEYCKEYGWIPEYIIYIKTDPNICLERINKRNRNGESSISLKYLQDIDKLYNELPNIYTSIKFYVVNGNEDEITVFRNVNDILNKIVKDEHLNNIYKKS